MNKVFIDTNIIVDLLDTTRMHSEESRMVIKILTAEAMEVVIGEDMLTTVYYIVKNKKDVLGFFDVVLRQWSVVGFGLDILTEGVNVSSRDNADFEDVLQSICASRYGCDMVITNDASFYGYGVPMYSSKEFIAKYSRRNI